MADAVAQYLSCYAQPEATAASSVVGSWPAAIVVPTYRESIELFDGLDVSLDGSRPLLIVVVNRRADDDDARADNDQLLAATRARGAVEAIAEGIELVGDVLLVDRSSDGRAFDPRDGVGLARRIGLDIALALWRRGVIESDWLHTTDADVTLPPSYLDVARAAPSSALALTRPYRHVLDGEPPREARALALYEISLRYYVLGLRWAGSPFAFSAIGSTISVRASAYAQVRGVPRRQAGEDFYLLSKLAKLGTIHRPASAPIEIRGVRAQRTPFGTAAAVASIAADAASYTLYHPSCFTHLRDWLEALEVIARTGQPGAAEATLTREPLAGCLEALGVDSGLEAACAQIKAPTKRRARLHAFFDAKKTLRLVHLLRDRGFANLEWKEALGQAPFLDELGSEKDPVAHWRNALERAENEGADISGVDAGADQN